MQELEALLHARDEEISDFLAEQALNKKKLEERSAAVQERASLEEAVKRQDEIITKQEAELERQAQLIKELEGHVADSTKTIAELQLRSSGTTKLAIFFGEPWLVTRSRHRLYGEAPIDREDGSLNHMGAKLLLFGGVGRVDGLVRDVAYFSLETKTWERSTAAGKQGAGRTCHTAAAVGKSKLCIYGGRRQAVALSDVHLLNSDNMKWTAPQIKGQPEDQAGRTVEGHACCTVREKVYTFGGMVNEALSSELTSFDTETFQWALVPSYGTPPSPRRGHVMVASDDGRYLWIFGGVDDTGTLADLTALDMDHQTWSAPVAAGPEAPKPREARTYWLSSAWPKELS